jgi:hypothetical protein
VNGKVSRTIPSGISGWLLQRGVGEFIVDLSQCPRPESASTVRVMLDDGRLERGQGMRTDLLSDGGLSFSIGNLYLEPIINEDCTIMGFFELNSFEDFTCPDM